MRALGLASPDAPLPVRGAVVVVDGLDAVRAAVAAATGAGPVSLDLYGHATRIHRHLRIGTDVLDLLVARVAAWARSLVADDLLARAGVARIRVLGCATAIGDAARASLVRLAAITRVPVWGTTRALLPAHLGPDGLRVDGRRLLVEVRPAGWPTHRPA